MVKRRIMYNLLYKYMILEHDGYAGVSKTLNAGSKPARIPTF